MRIHLIQRALALVTLTLLAGLLLSTGCKSESSGTTAAKMAAPAIRIDAGSAKPLTDKNGNLWLADEGFTGGNVVDRGSIAGLPELYQSEHYNMTAFSRSVPNGKYTVKLHFAETYSGVTAAGQRVFDVNVQGHQIKGLDVFKEAGGANKPLVKTVQVTVTDGALKITFTPQVQNAEINGIEIIPQ